MIAPRWEDDTMRHKRPTFLKRRRRRAAAAVEFAVVAPVFLTVVVGVSQASRLLDIHNELATAAREGARLAAMEREGILQQGQTTNQKVIDDVRNYLAANGMPTDDVEVSIVDPSDHETPFDLDAPENDLQLFELRVQLPASSVSSLAGNFCEDLNLGAQVVFRNGRAAIVQ
jgi:hypothetical protein